MPSNPRLSAALEYAARGWHIFPCAVGRKVPATKNGWLDATTDAAAIEAWWTENPDYNVAIATGPSNLCVIDVDPNGEASWDALVASDPKLAEVENLCPRVDTPRGGFHFYMEGEGVTSASKLAPGIDTRGRGGYVLAAPSYVDDGKSKGSYVGEPHKDTLPPVYQPLLSKLVREPRVTAPEPATPPEQVQWDLPETIRRAEAVLATFSQDGKVAVEGAGGDATTYEVACAVLEMGLTVDTAHRLLAEIWNPCCAPPWSNEELLDKVRNAWKYGQETKGGKAEPPLEQKYEHLLPPVEETDDPRGPPPALDPRYRPVSLMEARKNLPPLEWLIEGLIPKQGVGILYAAPASHKTFITLDLALSVATGLGVNWWKNRQEPGDVLYMIGEGAHAFKGQRTDSWISKNMVPGLDQHLDRLLVMSDVMPYYQDSEWRALPDWLRYYGIAPKLLVVDTHSRAMVGFNENDNSDTAKALSRVEEFSKKMGCFVLIVHHTGKEADRGARGSSAMLGNVDAMYELAKIGGDSYDTTLTVKKLKDGEAPKYPLLFQGRPYGESLAFHRDWEWKPDDKAPPEMTKNPEYLEPVVIAKAFGGARTILQAHLAETLAQQYDVSKDVVSRGLSKAKQGRLAAWFIDGMWTLPEGYQMPEKEEF